MFQQLTNMDWFIIWIIGLVGYINKTIDISRRKDFEVVLGVNEVINILAKGIMSDKYREKTNRQRIN